MSRHPVGLARDTPGDRPFGLARDAPGDHPLGLARDTPGDHPLGLARDTPGDHTVGLARDAPGDRPLGLAIDTAGGHPLAIAVDVAGRQHGVVSRGQLLEAGLSPRVIEGLVARRFLRPLHRGVYCVGAGAGPHGRDMAAVLACGGDAVISHWSAGALWRIMSRLLPGEPVHVLVPWRRVRRRPGVRARRARALAPADVTARHGVPVTTPARTLLDLAGELTTRELERLVARAERADLMPGDDLAAMLTEHPRHPGARALAAVTASAGPVPFVRSEAEECLLGLARKARLPEPRVNCRVHGFEVDFYWPAARLVVEVDGFTYHGSRAAFRRDRNRDATLIGKGLRVLRVTWEDLRSEPHAVVANLTRALAVRG